MHRTHPAYSSDAELRKWLRANSSGDYRLCAYAADRLEVLEAALEKCIESFKQIEQTFGSKP